ncbi:MAG: FAD-dependent oxidoreductase [Desulfurococcales archaeon]|nr:FAD-dependent oxidoreductase [Desulfurococcales archaeon]
MEKVDVAVIGAGVVGLFTGLELGSRGYTVAVIDKAQEPMTGVSSRSANVIHLIQPPFNSLKSRLCVEGNMLHRRLHKELGYRLIETRLLLAYTSRAKTPLAVLTAKLLPRLVPGGRVKTRILTGRTARDMEPGLSDRVQGAIEVRGYAIVDPASMAGALASRVRGYGELLLGSKVEAAEARGSRVILEAGGLRVSARLVVNAGGLESHVVAKMFGDSYTQEAWKGVMSIHPQPRLRSIVAPLEARRGETKGGGAIPQANGALLLGPNNAGPSRPGDYTYTSRDLEWLRSRFQPLLQEEIQEPVRVVVGHRPVAPGRDFLVEWGSTGRVIHLIGIESPGLTAAPALARMVASMARARGIL